MRTAWARSESQMMNDDLGLAAIDVYEVGGEKRVGLWVTLPARSHDVLVRDEALRVRGREDLVVPVAVRAHCGRSTTELGSLPVIGVGVREGALTMAATADAGYRASELRAIGSHYGVGSVAVTTGRGVRGLLVHDQVAVEGALVHGELVGVAVGARLERRLLPPAFGLSGGMLAGKEADVAGGAVETRVHRPRPVVGVHLHAAQRPVHFYRAQTLLRVTGEAALVLILSRLRERLSGEHRPGGERRQSGGQGEGQQAAVAHGAVTPRCWWQSLHMLRGWQTRQDSSPLVATAAWLEDQSLGWSTWWHWTQKLW